MGGLEFLKGSIILGRIVREGHLVLGHDVHGGQYIVGRNARGTAFPITKYPADNLQGGTKLYQRSIYYLGVASTSVLRRCVLLPQRLVSHSAIAREEDPRPAVIFRI